MRITYNLLGFILGSIFRYRFRISMQNIARAFPSASYQEVSKYHTSFYQYLGRVLIESLFPINSPLQIHSESLTKLNQLKQEDRSIILIFGHYGNWEIMNQLPLCVDNKIQALYKPIKSSFWDKRMKAIREYHGMRLIAAQQGLRTLLREKGDSSITLFIADQFPGRDNGISVEFLNQKTQVFTGAEQIARKLNAYVAYAELVPIGNRGWEVQIETISEFASSTTKGDISLSFIKKLEQSIQRNPGMWLWSHKRWK